MADRAKWDTTAQMIAKSTYVTNAKARPTPNLAGAMFEDCIRMPRYTTCIADPLKDYLQVTTTTYKAATYYTNDHSNTVCRLTAEYKDVGESGPATYVFLGVVWRTFEPGTKLDEIPVLAGGRWYRQEHVTRNGCSARYSGAVR